LRVESRFPFFYFSAQRQPLLPSAPFGSPGGGKALKGKRIRKMLFEEHRVSQSLLFRSRRFVIGVAFAIGCTDCKSAQAGILPQRAQKKTPPRWKRGGAVSYLTSHNLTSILSPPSVQSRRFRWLSAGNRRRWANTKCPF